MSLYLETKRTEQVAYAGSITSGAAIEFPDGGHEPGDVVVYRGERELWRGTIDDFEALLSAVADHAERVASKLTKREAS